MEVTRGIAIRSFIWKLLERTSVQIVQFAVTIILARLLMPSEYGLIALIMVLINICQVIVDGGFNTALVQKKDADNVDFSTIFYFGILMSTVIYLILFFSAPLISSFYSQPDLTNVIRVLGCILFLYAINAVQNAYISRNLLFRKLFVCSLGSVSISGFIGILMAYNGFGVWSLVAQTLMAQLTLTIIMWIMLGWRPEIAFSNNSLKRLLNYGWKIFFTNLIVVIFVNIRKLIIGKFYTPASLAYFERGDQFPNLFMSNIQTSIQSVLFPVFSIEQDDSKKVKQMLRRSTKSSCFVIYPLMMLLIVSAKPLVLFLLTDKWLPVVTFMQIFCIANFFRPVTIPNIEAIKAMGYSGISLKLELIKKVLDVTILVISMFFGVLAIAWGIVAFNFFCVFINLYPNKQLLNYGITEQIKDALPTLFLTLIMGAVIYWIQFISVPLIIILFMQFVAGAFVYLSLCHIFKVESYCYIYSILKEKILC